MNIKPLHADFKCPVKSTQGAGAYDLYMPEDGYYEDFADPVVVDLGFAAKVPDGHVALLLPRSGVGFKHGVELNNTCGVIDSDYLGEWKASVATKSGSAYEWKAGDRVLQMLIVPVLNVEFNLVEDLGMTDRGDGGFGSTGK